MVSLGKLGGFFQGLAGGIQQSRENAFQKELMKIRRDEAESRKHALEIEIDSNNKKIAAMEDSNKLQSLKMLYDIQEKQTSQTQDELKGIEEMIGSLTNVGGASTPENQEMVQFLEQMRMQKLAQLSAGMGAWNAQQRSIIEMPTEQGIRDEAVDSARSATRGLPSSMPSAADELPSPTMPQGLGGPAQMEPQQASPAAPQRPQEPPGREVAEGIADLGIGAAPPRLEGSTWIVEFDPTLDRDTLVNSLTNTASMRTSVQGEGLPGASRSSVTTETFKDAGTPEEVMTRYAIANGARTDEEGNLKDIVFVPRTLVTATAERERQEFMKQGGGFRRLSTIIEDASGEGIVVERKTTANPQGTGEIVVNAGKIDDLDGHVGLQGALKRYAIEVASDELKDLPPEEQTAEVVFRALPKGITDSLAKISQDAEPEFVDMGIKKGVVKEAGVGLLRYDVFHPDAEKYMDARMDAEALAAAAPEFDLSERFAPIDPSSLTVDFLTHIDDALPKSRVFQGNLPESGGSATTGDPKEAVRLLQILHAQMGSLGPENFSPEARSALLQVFAAIRNRGKETPSWTAFRREIANSGSFAAVESMLMR